FNATPTTEIYTLSLHDALPILIMALVTTALTTPALHLIFPHARFGAVEAAAKARQDRGEAAYSILAPVSLPESGPALARVAAARSEEHTSELQSQSNLVCRLLL